MLLYPVYTLLFDDTALSVWQISSLFVIWSLSTISLEVPSGAWADATSRRRLLTLGPLLTAVAFALWVGWPSFWTFAAGFLLWGLKGALTSGALEALVFEELQRSGATDRYPTLMGRGQVAGVLAAMCSGAIAAPVFSAGGFAAVGAGSVAVCVAAAAVAMLFPENRVRPKEEEADLRFADALTQGLAEVRRSPRVRAAVILVAAVASIWGALDEYAPLLLESFGASAAGVAALMVVIWAGAAAGGLLADRATGLSPRWLAVLIGAAATLMAGGALSGHPLAVIPLAVAFGLFQLVTIVADTRLQNSISGSARATVTSLAGMSTDVILVVVYTGYAVAAEIGGHGGAFATLMVPYLAVALWLNVTRRLTSTIVEGAGSWHETSSR